MALRRTGLQTITRPFSVTLLQPTTKFCSVRPALQGRLLSATSKAMGQDDPRSTSDRQLWDRVVQSYRAAQHKGVAYQTETQTEVLQEPPGIKFIVRNASALRDKPRGNKGSAGAKPANPFLPYDEILWVGHLSDTHTCLLNKYNVIEHHLLVITRQFESQMDPLNAADFDATCKTLQAFPAGALAFFNRGPVSGASQPHKHVQVVPLPLGDDASNRLPLAPIIHQAWQDANPEPLAALPLTALPFRCWCTVLPEGAAAENAWQAYQNLMDAAGLSGSADDTSYNWWFADGVMLLAVRTQEACGPVAVNTLGFAGTILVKSDDQQQYLERHGCMHVLQKVGAGWK